MFLDAIQRGRIKRSPKKRFFKLWLLPILLILGFIFFYSLGQIGADFALDNIQPISLFKNGKYLVLFQNNSEIRSSGGFMGSYAVIDVDNFEIKNINFNTNIFALDRAFADKNFVQAPEPIARMTKGYSWTLRDANYDASFPDAAQDIILFYNRETGEQVDGIIALNAKVMVDLLKLTGPVRLDQYNLTITSDNFYRETQSQVETEYFANPENRVINEPKTFIKDLYPEILNQAFRKKIALIGLISQELEQKEILFYFKDSFKQSIAEKHNWAGKIPSNQELKDHFETNEPVDYLYINSNNYSATKSSLSIQDDINYQVSRDDSGRLMANLKIDHFHHGSYAWPDGNNITWMRIYVPLGSKLKQATINGLDVSGLFISGEESEKTFFGIELTLEPGQANILELSYTLPFATSNYHLLVQKQPGVIDSGISVKFKDRVLFDGIIDKDKEISF